MKFLLLLALISSPAFATDISSSNDGLPAIYKRVAGRESYTCMVVKVSVTDHRLDSFFDTDLSVDDVGQYVLLSSVSSGRSEHRSLVGVKSASLEKVAMQIVKAPECGAGQSEISSAQAVAELDSAVDYSRTLASE